MNSGTFLHSRELYFLPVNNFGQLGLCPTLGCGEACSGLGRLTLGVFTSLLFLGKSHGNQACVDEIGGRSPVRGILGSSVVGNSE